MRSRNKSPLWRRVARALGTRVFLHAENSGDARIGRNGEDWLLASLMREWLREPASAGAKRIIFDAGANRGDFTAAVLAAADREGVAVEVHAFEPGSAAAALLGKRFAGDARVSIVNSAVSDFEGRTKLFNSAGASSLASLVRRDPGTGEAGDDVAVTTLAAHMERIGLARIDFLKLDIEGAELPALRGLGDRLSPDSIPMIQFEYGGTTLDAGHRLRDFFELLEGRGYMVAKLFPGWIEPRRYAAWMDNFHYANWVAVGESVATGLRKE